MGTAALIVTGAGLAAFYWLTVRPWFRTWGSVEAERLRPMAGDGVVTGATYEATLAVTVDAAPEQIWPWLVQMGYRRGGLYSYDWLDRLFGYLDKPSADRILPEFQRLAAGDVIPIGRGGGFPVTTVVPYRALVLSGEANGVAWLWEFGLFPIDSRRTRLVSRNRVRARRTLASWLFMRAVEPAAFLMTRRMLLGLKQRAEGLRADRLAA
jgi:hypothetical protein